MCGADGTLGEDFPAGVTGPPTPTGFVFDDCGGVLMGTVKHGETASDDNRSAKSTRGLYERSMMLFAAARARKRLSEQKKGEDGKMNGNKMTLR